MRLYDCFGRMQISWLYKQRHAAAQLSLDASGRRCNAVRHPFPVQQRMESQSLLIILKENIPADLILRH